MVMLIKKFLPKSLLGRSLMIIVTPLVLLQLVSGLVFFESHWDKVTLRLARGVASDISAVVDLMRRHPAIEDRDWIFDVASQNLQLSVFFEDKAVLENTSFEPSGLMEEMLVLALQDHVQKPFQIDANSLEKHVRIEVQLSTGVLEVVANRKRLFSSTTYVFVFWMIGTSLILFGVATIFMRNQVRPIRKLADAAAAFGMGRTVARFKPEGATEVRQAASAFVAMRDRIARHIAQRTDMLAGVSHDLRTPLTRMKLQLAMQEHNAETEELKSDIGEMEHMLEGYLAFARGEGAEQPELCDLGDLLSAVVNQARRKGALIDLHTEGEIKVMLRPITFKRCITNLLDNAIRYADNIAIRAGVRGDVIEIAVDDDGPGVSEDKREDIFKPFVRVDDSRNQETGGVGLGLTIVRDGVRVHGGDIELEDSPLGGLRARLRLPL